MTTQFSPKLSEILAFSREEAARLASRSVGPEHLLLGILRSNEGPVIDLFNRLNLNMQAVKTELGVEFYSKCHGSRPGSPGADTLIL